MARRPDRAQPRGRPSRAGTGRSATCRRGSRRPGRWPAPMLMPIEAEKSPMPKIRHARRPVERAIESMFCRPSTSSMRASSPMRRSSLNFFSIIVSSRSAKRMSLALANLVIMIVSRLREGRVLWDQALPGMEPRDRVAVWDETNRVIAQLHGVPPAAAGLSGARRRRGLATWPGGERLGNRRASRLKVPKRGRGLLEIRFSGGALAVPQAPARISSHADKKET